MKKMSFPVLQYAAGLVGSAVFVLGCTASSSDPSVGVISQPVCSAGGLSSDAANGSAAIGSTVTWTGTASCQQVNPVYRFWIQDPNTLVWTLLRDYDTSNTFQFDSTGYAAGTYNWMLWVREAGSGEAYEAYNGQPLTLTTGKCSSVVGSSANSAAIGSQTTLTATGNCIGTGQYRFWHLPPGGPWEMLQDYSNANTFQWTVTGPVGHHDFQVWAKAAGSPGQYESYHGWGMTVTNSSACTSVSATTSPSGTATVGQTVTITPTSSCGGTPEYRYQARRAGGSWQVLQEWSTNPSFDWVTTTALQGYYDLNIWVRNTGSPSVYEAFTGFPYTLSPSAHAFGSLAQGASYHNVALLADGSLASWGYSEAGAHGHGGFTVATPSTISGISGVKQVAAGYNHSCAVLSSDGSVRCWGSNVQGQLGDGSNTSSSTPVAVSGLTGVQSVVGGGYHTCALLAGGTASCWGYNSQGALGNGQLSNASSPQTVTGLTNAVALAAGYYHTCALISGGTVSCWGGNASGQLGDGTNTNRPAPTPIPGLAGVKAIAANNQQTCAVLNDGSLRCWGSNGLGQLGDGTTTDRNSPVAITLPAVSAVALGARNTCAIVASNGSVRCWGQNTYGALGNGSNTDSTSPVAVSNITGATSIAVGWYHACAGLEGQNMSCWGWNGQAELGDGTYTSSNIPVATVAVP